MNWMLDRNEGIGRALAKKAKEKGVGLLGMKSFIERAWKDDAEKRRTPNPGASRLVWIKQSCAWRP